MIRDKLKKIFSFNGISLLIGILGSIASILTIFINKWDSLISLKWLVFVLFLSISIILVLIKLTFDLVEEVKRKSPNSSKVIRYIPMSKAFLTSKNDTLGYSAMVSIFYIEDSYEIEFGKGFVNNIQEQMTQIQLLEISEDFSINYSSVVQKIEINDAAILNRLIIKSYISYTK